MTLIGNTTRFEASVMTHRCTVERDSADDTDRYDVPAFATHLSDQPCFLYTTNVVFGGEAVRPEGTVVADELKMLMPLGTDVQPADRVVDVLDKAGGGILAGTFDIASVLPHHSHIELVLRRVTGGA